MKDNDLINLQAMLQINSAMKSVDKSLRCSKCSKCDTNGYKKEYDAYRRVKRLVELLIKWFLLNNELVKDNFFVDRSKFDDTTVKITVKMINSSKLKLERVFESDDEL